MSFSACSLEASSNGFAQPVANARRNPLFWVTDEERIKAFNPMEKKFYILHTYLEALGKVPYSTFHRMIESAYPVFNSRLAFLDWATEWLARGKQFFVVPTIVEYIEFVSQTNFSDWAERAAWEMAMNLHTLPFMALGCSNYGGVETCYGLESNINYLTPNFIAAGDEHHPRVIESSVLGINTNVALPLHPGRVGGRNPECESNLRAALPGDENHPHGFVFAQLGSLCVF
ncbi:hypothetical protein CTRI78_v008295 [Colletotrichum trifolii]|uniref:Uncharacterized protein n=1 Tax=Colletotrichum trifolii TaxID=5466 RepID=A0A4R8QWR7_COLTR|nr:hypothetical protein CTRI78_v008295 [Colletotrichum trifolii]